jgi:hypothetical protein
VIAPAAGTDVPTVGAYPVRDGFLRIAARWESFRAPAAPESLFSAWPEKSNPKRGHPVWRLPGVAARQVREPGTGFSTGLLSGRKGVDLPVDSHWRGLSPPSHRRAGGSDQTRKASCICARENTDRPCADWPRSHSPVRRVRRGCPARRGIGRRPIPFRRYMDVPSKSQATAHELFARLRAKSAKRGASLFGYFLSGKREKVTRAPQALETLLLSSLHKESHHAQGALTQGAASVVMGAAHVPEDRAQGALPLAIGNNAARHGCPSSARRRLPGHGHASRDRFPSRVQGPMRVAVNGDTCRARRVRLLILRTDHG